MLNSNATATYGWCDRCKDRVGIKHYRLLINGLCNDCKRKWGEIVVGDKADNKPKQATKPPAPKKKKPCRVPERRTFTRPSETEFRQEEEKFLKTLHELQLFDSNWVSPMAIALQWSHEKTRNVGRRLKRKGNAVPLGSTSARLLQLIDRHPWIDFQKLKELIPNISSDWLENLLLKAVKNEGLIVLEDSVFKVCQYHTAMDFLIFALRSGSICAYSQKFRCYGVFVDDRDPEAIAAIRLKCPVIVSEKLDFFKYWIPAHSIIVGNGEGVSATTDLFCEFPKGETLIQDCLNEVENKRQLFLESEARKAMFTPGGL